MRPLDTRLRTIALVAGLVLGSELMARTRVDGVTAAAEGETLDGAVRRNVARILSERRGAEVLEPARDVVWLDAPTGDLGLWSSTRRFSFAALAVPPGSGKARDLFRLDARVTPYGVVFDDGWIVNLTGSKDADDGHLAAHGPWVATSVAWGGQTLAFELRDLRGAPGSSQSLLRRLGDTVTHLEQSGTTKGLTLHRFAVTGALPQGTRALTALNVAADGVVTALSGTEGWGELRPADGAATGLLAEALTYEPPAEDMQYDFLNWLADRGRGLADQGLLPEWSGSGIELMKEVYFKAEEVKAKVEEVVASPEPAAEVKEVETVVQKAAEKARLEVRENKRPWPPPPIEPLLGDRLKGEGIWEPVGEDRVTHVPGAPSPFYTSFVRPDAEFPQKRVVISAWDPELVSLKMRAGTTNPVPTTGNRGDGKIPRDAATLARVVGGFNGGFQTAHIWYGMMVDRKVLLPPREYGATAGSWEDGRTVFATWKPGAPVPEGLTHFRQNLPPLLEDGAFNPYGRNTWGWHKNVAGAVSGKTIRTALCYTGLGHAMYFYAEFTDEHTLTKSLKAAGCVYGIHLDMNRGHSGFEFYKRLDDDAPGAGEEMATVEGVRLRGSTLHPTNKHMKAPVRYLGTDYRDYFYLELRDVLPGAPVELGERPHPWQTTTLPDNADFPPRYALATPSGAIALLSIDTNAAVFAESMAALPPEASLSIALPVGEAPAGAVEGRPLAGVPLPEGDGLVGIAFGASGHAGRFVSIARLAGARSEEVRALLLARGVEAPLFRPLPADAPPTLAYQSRSANGTQTFVEAPLGADSGTVVNAPSFAGPSLFIAAVTRPSAIVRLFPEMRPTPKRR